MRLYPSPRVRSRHRMLSVVIFGVGSTGGTTAMKDDKASLMSELDERSIIGWVSEDISVTCALK